MSDDVERRPSDESAAQLTQTRVPLDQAAQAFSIRDEYGRLPIVVEPQRTGSVQYPLLWIALILCATGIISGAIIDWLLPILLIAAAVALVLAVFRLFYLRIPEGVNGLLSKGGRYTRTVGPGTHWMLPNVAVTHLVTKREIPYDVPVAEATTRDSVRASIDTLLTFSIVEPYRFVYNISADDFDRVLQASAQDALRLLTRGITAEEVLDLQRSGTAELQAAIGSDVEPYGVTIKRVVVTFAQPPADYMHSLEQQRLAVVQRAEQQERQTLELQRQGDRSELASRQVETEAAREELRLQQLEDRIRRFPAAAQYDLERARLDVARALAGNNRTLLQVGGVDDLARSMLLRDVPAVPDADTLDRH
jgi:regulator of protease activity HflC (stomatin/prohibitin superfamily)